MDARFVFRDAPIIGIGRLLRLGLERYHEAYPILLASSDTNTQYRYRVWRYQNNTSVSQIYFHLPMLLPQSLSPPIRRMDSLRNATSASAIHKGRKRWSVILFYRTYDLLSWIATKVCVGGGGRGRRACGRVGERVSLQSPLVSATMPPPVRRQLTGTPVRSWNTDGRAGDVRVGARWSPALDCTRRWRCCVVICNKYIAVT